MEILRKTSGAALGLLAAGMTLLPSPAIGTPKFGFAFFAGRNTYAMDDVNDELISEVNVSLAGTGYEMDEITGGWGFGGGLRIKPAPSIMVGLDFERLTANSEISIFDERLEIDTPANSFLGTVTYYFPSSSRARVGVGAGLGYYTSGGSIAGDSAGVGLEVDVDGNGIGFHGAASLDVGISPNVHFEALAGYRYAKTSDVEVGGSKAYTADGDEATLDWSGFMSRTGLIFYIGPQ